MFLCVTRSLNHPLERESPGGPSGQGVMGHSGSVHVWTQESGGNVFSLCGLSQFHHP